MGKSIILGIDPGIMNGAYALYDFKLKQLLLVNQLPLFIPERTIKSKPFLDLEALCFELRKHPIRCAVVEIVHSMPGQGVGSTFRFGVAYGQILGILAALGIEVFGVEPSVWKGLLNLESFDKDASRSLAAEIFPTMAWNWKLKKDHNLAEAALIAKFGERIVCTN